MSKEAHAKTATLYNLLLCIRAMLYSLLTIHAHGHSSVMRLATKKSMLSVVAVIVVIIIDIPRTTKYTYSHT